MPSATEIKQLATSPVLHKGEEAGWYVLGGEHYVIVCGAVGQLAVNPGQIGPAANPSPFGR